MPFFPTIPIIFTVFAVPVGLLLWSRWLRSRPIPKSPSTSPPLGPPSLVRALSFSSPDDRFGLIGVIGGAGRVQPFEDGLWLIPNPPLSPRWVAVGMDEIVEFEVVEGVLFADITFRTARWEVAFSMDRKAADGVRDWPRERKRRSSSPTARPTATISSS